MSRTEGERSAWCSGSAEGDGEPPALAYYGILRHDTVAVMLRFHRGPADQSKTEDFLGWAASASAADGKRVFVLVWDDAPWHVSKRAKERIEAHNGRVARGGGCRIGGCGLPVKAPWLNAIEPKWAHGKGAVAEPARVLTAEELMWRVHDHYGCRAEPLMTQNVA